jgi:DNA-binding transcriptional ArsR family regulator
MLAAMGAEPRLHIMRLLLSAHPQGMVVGEIGAELGMTGSTLSHHLEKLKSEDLVSVTRESTFLRYAAKTESLRELLGFLYAECCTRNQAIEPEAIIQIAG